MPHTLLTLIRFAVQELGDADIGRTVIIKSTAMSGIRFFMTFSKTAVASCFGNRRMMVLQTIPLDHLGIAPLPAMRGPLLETEAPSYFRICSSGMAGGFDDDTLQIHAGVAELADAADSNNLPGFQLLSPCLLAIQEGLAETGVERYRRR